MSQNATPPSRLKQPSKIAKLSLTASKSAPTPRNGHAGPKEDFSNIDGRLSGFSTPSVSRENSFTKSQLPVMKRESSIPQIKRESSVPKIRRELSTPQMKRESSIPQIKQKGSATPLSSKVSSKLSKDNHRSNSIPAAPTPRGESSQTQIKRRTADVQPRKPATETPSRITGEIGPRLPLPAVSGKSGNLKIGDRVSISGSGSTKKGVIQFIGETRFAKGDWAGVVLDEPIGKNDGTVGGVRYFQCQPNYGVFVKVDKLVKITDSTDKNYKPHGTPQSISATPAKTPNSDIVIPADLKVGNKVSIGENRVGILRYLGETGFAKGVWCGVELDQPVGKNDGAVAGTR